MEMNRLGFKKPVIGLSCSISTSSRGHRLGEAPDLVIGSGGYVSGPLVAVASIKGIPTAIMEQNAIPGLTNRILSRFVDKIYTSFENTINLPKKKIVCMGNPVRSASKREPHPIEWQTSCTGSTIGEGDLRILVFGG